MNKCSNFSKKVLQFNDDLSQVSLHLPDGFKVLNPFTGPQREQVKRIMKMFYQKYYNDTHKRRLILGSSPARRGSAVIGVPFEDTRHLRQETGISIDHFYINRASSDFLFDVMEKYGGCKKFYADFYMNFVCPLGISKVDGNGKEVNCNYYENKKLKESLKPFIVNSLLNLINLGIDTLVCYCIGSGENYKFLLDINKEYHFFKEIIPLEHPRFIMQYNRKRKEEFLEKYLQVLGYPMK